MYTIFNNANHCRYTCKLAEISLRFSDDLPMRGFIGHLEESGFLPHTHKVFLWAHLNFNIEYNGDQVLHKQKVRKQKLYMHSQTVTIQTSEYWMDF